MKTPSQLQLTWIAEYHGPNPQASGPIVCAQIVGTAAFDQSALRRALQSVNHHYPFMATDPLPLAWPAVTSGLAVVGVDYLAPDIPAAPQPGHRAFIEINAKLGLSICVVAGFSEAALGEQVLGPAPDRIAVSLWVAARDQIEKQQDRLRSLQLQEGHGRMIGNAVPIGSVHSSALNSQPWEAVRTVLRNRSLCRLEIYATLSQLEKHGLPVDCLDMVKNMAPDMPRSWRAVLLANSNELIEANLGR
jgi:hypothetical protein